MAVPRSAEVTGLLRAWSGGDRAAFEPKLAKVGARHYIKRDLQPYTGSCKMNPDLGIQTQFLQSEYGQPVLDGALGLGHRLARLAVLLSPNSSPERPLITRRNSICSASSGVTQRASRCEGRCRPVLIPTGC